MTLFGTLRAFARQALRNPSGALRHVAVRLRDDPVWVLLKFDAALPDGLRARLHDQALRLRPDVGSVLAVVALVAEQASGQQASLTERLQVRMERAGERERAWVGRFLVHVEAPEQALIWLEGADSPRAMTARGLALGRCGEWSAAVSALGDAVERGAGSGAKSELVRARATLQALQPGWVPAAPPGRPVAPSPGRALHLLNNGLPHVQAGYTVRAQRVAKALRDVGYDPVMLTRPGFPWDTGFFDAATTDDVDGITYHHVRADELIGAGLAQRAEIGARRAAPLVAELRPALLHPTSPHVNAQLALALRETFQIPVVYEVRGFLEDTWLSRREDDASEREHYRLTRETEATCARAADQVVTLGAAMRQDLISRGVDAERITVVPNGVDIDTFRPTGSGSAVRRSLGWDDEVVLGYVTSVVPYEGIEVLLSAIRELHDRGHRQVRGLIVGDGSARRTLEATATQLGLKHSVTFTGRVPHERIQGYYEAIDVFVVPRRDQRVCRMVTPLKPVEAMALERCVVVSALPALEELLIPGRTGFTFPAEDAAGLADVVAPLLNDPGRRAEVGKLAREQVAQERTWASNGKRYRAVYERIGVHPQR